jgi:hypothetical protein
MKSLIVAGMSAAACLGAAPAMAATLSLGVAGEARGCAVLPSDSYNSNLSSPAVSSLSRSASVASGGCQVSSEAIAGEGLAGFRVDGYSTTEDGYAQAVSNTRYQLDIVTPQGFSGTVSMTMNIALDALMSVEQFNNSPFEVTAAANLRATLQLQYNDGSTWRSLNRIVDHNISATAERDTPVASDTLAVDETISFDNLTVDPTKDLFIRFGISGNIFFSGESGRLYQTSGSASIDAMNTLSFAPNAFVFDQAGVSITDAGVGIFNNQWVDPRTPTTPVPLPASGLLLLAGLGGLALMRRRTAA